MNTNLAIRESVLPSHAELDVMLTLGEQFLKSGLLPTTIKSAAAAVLIIQKGNEIRIPPAYALSNIVVIQGKPTANAELMLSLIFRDHGDDAIDFVETTESGCTISYKRRTAKERRTYSFTMADARAAELLGNATWKKYPKAMLRARCISAVARFAFPDSIAGMYTPEELGAKVDEEGYVVGEPANVTDITTRQNDGPPATAAQVKAMYVIARNEGQLSEAAFEAACLRLFQTRPDYLSRRQANDIIDQMKNGSFWPRVDASLTGTTDQETPVQQGNTDVRTIDTTTGEIQEYRPGNHQSAENIRAKFRASTLDGDTSTISEDDADTLEMILNDHTHNGAASRAIVCYLCGKTVTFKTVSRVEMTKLLDLVNSDSAAKLIAILTPAALEWNAANPHSEPSLHEQLLGNPDEDGDWLPF